MSSGKYELSNGNVIIASEDYIALKYPDAVLVEVEVEVEEEVEPVVSKIMTRLQFRELFTDEEKIDIELYAIDVQTDPIEQRRARAGLRSFMKDLDSADFVDLNDPKVLTGLSILVQLEILTESRLTEISQYSLND